ncbi:polygalacturonase-like [Prunus yedoensis var. nudiflora]|uniref:Polygalacturonase-like n=1 Tax=Prunus yedoensis var. nudiflora TaxID=2094558 RepID=A0A314UH01_PRUYE|nr:polygalacturonase-like [Prunus yedoensis var. nudiflora]
MAEVTTSCFSRVALLMILYILHQPCVAESTLIFNVLSFGAKPNGVIDSTQAFLDVWTAACASSDSTTIRVPKGRYLLRNAMVFKGDNCKSTDITFRIDGTLIASSDYRILGQANNWLSFEGVTGVSIIRGALDAKGTSLWACKLAGSTDCPNGGATGTQNGLRIKSGASPSNGFVQGVQFLDVVMFNVQNPIVIDKNYCPHNINCPAQVSGVKVSHVVYRNIQGTSATAVAIKFDCSATNPCSWIRLENVSLTSRNQEIQSHCANANGKIVGTVQPNGCL